jgi:hypothetical protein
LVEQEDQERHQMTRDAAFAQGCRLAWRCVPITVLVAVLSFLALGAAGNFAERIEIANSIQRIAQ